LLPLELLIPLAETSRPLQAAVTAIRLDGVKYHNPSVTRITDKQPEQVNNQNDARPVAKQALGSEGQLGAQPHVPYQPGPPRPKPRHPDQPPHLCSVRPCRTSQAPLRGLAVTPAEHGASTDAGPQPGTI
jgi:hypothetical protein